MGANRGYTQTFICCKEYIRVNCVITICSDPVKKSNQVFIGKTNGPSLCEASSDPVKKNNQVFIGKPNGPSLCEASSDPVKELMTE